MTDLTTEALEHSRPFRILSIDGGGTRGVYPAALLAQIEAITQRRIVDHFDLIAGTSTGGLIALGLAAGVPAATLLEFYLTRGPQIFPPSPTSRAALAWWWIQRRDRALFHREPLERALEDVLGNRRMEELLTRVVIPTFDVACGEIRLIKTPHHPNIKRDGDRRLVDVALATSAAPVVLPGFTSDTSERLIDGGVWANTPVSVAVNEAVGYLSVGREQVHVLSLGTTHAPYHVPEDAMSGGLRLLWHFVGGGASGMWEAASRTSAVASARVLVGDSERFLRIDQTVAAGRFGMVGVKQMKDLHALGQRDAMHHARRIEEQFLTTGRNFPGLGHPFGKTL